LITNYTSGTEQNINDRKTALQTANRAACDSQLAELGFTISEITRNKTAEVELWPICRPSGAAVNNEHVVIVFAGVGRCYSPSDGHEPGPVCGED